MLATNVQAVNAQDTINEENDIDHQAIASE